MKANILFNPALSGILEGSLLDNFVATSTLNVVVEFLRRGLYKSFSAIQLLVTTLI